MSQSFSLASKLIFKDPINLLLAFIPTILSLSLYFVCMILVYQNSHLLTETFRGYVFTANQASLWSNVFTFVFIVFIFFLMSWTFVLVAGMIAAPFNSLLSSRIEAKLCDQTVSTDKSEAFRNVFRNLGRTFKNELKKILFFVLIGALALILNFIPLLYPVSVMLLAILLSIQFVDYSWSRHDVVFGTCLNDVMKNIIPYGLSGLIFLMFVSIPFINALVPAYATSYYTVLWLHRQNKISPPLT